jgi:hypothetical protein
LLGVRSASGLSHQLDVAVHLDDAILVAELKAYGGRLPKNDLLKFVAATNDLYSGLGHSVPRLPIYRSIAGTFAVSDGARTYAAQHGVLLIEPSSIPSLILASAAFMPPVNMLQLSPDERFAAATLARPMQLQHAAARTRPASSSPPFVRGAFAFAIRTQSQWSSRLGLDGDLTSAPLVHGPEIAA